MRHMHTVWIFPYLRTNIHKHQGSSYLRRVGRSHFSLQQSLGEVRSWQGEVRFSLSRRSVVTCRVNSYYFVFICLPTSLSILFMYNAVSFSLFIYWSYPSILIILPWYIFVISVILIRVKVVHWKSVRMLVIPILMKGQDKMLKPLEKHKF